MKLLRELIVLDLETTGLWVEKDKIIEIALVRLCPDGRQESLVCRINPGIPIPPVVSELTGITDADVAAAPLFRDVAGEVLAFIGDADLSGFNIERFDLPLLAREFFEAGITFDWQERTIYDVQRIYHFHEKRDLTAAYQFYCNKQLHEAHSALGDAQATLEILAEQVKRYGEGSDDLISVGNVKTKKVDTYFDKDRKLKWWNGELYPTFGKYARRMSLTELAHKDPAYLEWILTSDFDTKVKEAVQDVLHKKGADV